jgi:hypothetical protein
MLSPSIERSIAAWAQVAIDEYGERNSPRLSIVLEKIFQAWVPENLREQVEQKLLQRVQELMAKKLDGIMKEARDHAERKGRYLEEGIPALDVALTIAEQRGVTQLPDRMDWRELMIDRLLKASVSTPRPIHHPLAGISWVGFAPSGEHQYVVYEHQFTVMAA